MATYRKRLDGGVGKDDGRDYECALHHAVAVNALARGLRGEQTSEEDGLDCLDDLAFHHDGSVILVQAKYCSKLKGRVTLDNLRAKKHEFALETYYKAYQQSEKYVSSKNETVERVVLFSNRSLEKECEMLEKIDSRDDELPFPVGELLGFPATAGQTFYRVSSEWLQSASYAPEALMHCSAADEEDHAQRKEFLSKVILALDQPNFNDLQNIVNETFRTLDYCQAKSADDVDQARRKLTSEITDWVKKRDKELGAWTVDETRKVLQGFERHVHMQKVRGLSDDNQHRVKQHISIRVQPGVPPTGSGTLATRQLWLCAQLAARGSPPLAARASEPTEQQPVLLTAEQFAAQPDFVLAGVGDIVVMHDKAAASGPPRQDLELAVAARGGLLLTNDLHERDAEWLVRADDLADDCLADILRVGVDVQGRSLTLGDLLPDDGGADANLILGPATIERVVRGQPLSVGRPVPLPLSSDALLAPKHYIERSVAAFQPGSSQAEYAPLAERRFAERHRAVVAAPAGMGKSSLLRSVAGRMSRMDPWQWALLCDLSERKDALRRAEPPETPEQCKALLLALLRELLAVTDGEGAELELRMLDSGLDVRGHVTLLFDGYDEIHFEGGQAFMQLLRWLGEQTEVGLWVATRDQSVEELLEAVGESEGFRIQGLTEKDQSKLWEILTPQGVVLNLRGPLASKKFFENPLHVTMLSEVAGGLTEDERRNGLRLHSLYGKFVDYKFDAFFERKKLYDPRMQEKHKQEIIEAFQQLGMMDLFRKGWQGYADPDEQSRSKEELVDCALEPDFGLLRRDARGAVLFVHQTFAEFFTSGWLHARLKRAQPPVDGKLLALLHRVMMYSNFHGVRTFLDDQFADAGTGPETWPRSTVLREFCETFLSVPVKEGLPWLSRFLWRFRGALSEEDQCRAFYEAVVYARIPVVEEALRDAHFRPAVAGLRDQDKTPLHWALSNYRSLRRELGPELYDARLGRLLELLLVEAGCEAGSPTTSDQITAVHQAAKKGSLCAVRRLLEQGCATDRARLELLQTTSGSGWTALHFAAASLNQDAELLVFLIEEELRLLQALRPPVSEEGDFAALSSRLSLYRAEHRKRQGVLPLIGAWLTSTSGVQLTVSLKSTDIPIGEGTLLPVRTLWRYMNEPSQMMMAGVNRSEVRAMPMEAMNGAKWFGSIKAAAFALAFALPADGDWRSLRAQSVSAVCEVGDGVTGQLLTVALNSACEREPGTTTAHQRTLLCGRALSDALRGGRDWNDALVVTLCSWLVDLALMNADDNKLVKAEAKRQALAAMRTGGAAALREWALHCAGDQSDGFSREARSELAEVDGDATWSIDQVRRLLEAWVTLLVARAADVRLALDARRVAEAHPQLDGSAEVLQWAADVETGTVRCLALHYAALVDADLVVKWLARRGRCDVDARHRGSTPLHVAARLGHHMTVRRLLKAGCDFTATDAGGRTPLHCAAASGAVKTVRALLEAGSDVTARDAEGRTALVVAAECTSRATAKSSKATIKAAAKAKSEPPAMQFADRLLALVQRQDADGGTARDEYGLTALHYAAALGDAVLTLLLLFVAGCDPNARDAAGRTALQFAATMRGSTSRAKAKVVERLFRLKDGIAGKAAKRLARRNVTANHSAEAGSTTGACNKAGSTLGAPRKTDLPC